MRSPAVTQTQTNIVKSQEVKKGVSSLLTLKNAAITAFVLGLLSAAVSITLWQVGGINPWMTIAFAGAGALLLMGVAIATVISCCKSQGTQKQNTTTKTAAAKSQNAASPSKTVADPTPAALKAKILRDILDPAIDPQKIIDAIETSGTKTIETFFEAALKSNRFNLVSAFLIHFDFSTSILCQQYSELNDDLSNAKMAIEIRLGVHLLTAIKSDQDSTAKLILETLPTLNTLHLEVMFEADAKKCVTVFLSLYPQQIEKSITTRLLQNPSVPDKDGMLNLVSAHNVAIKEKEIPKAILKLVKDDKNKDELLKVMKDNFIRPNKLINGKIIILWAAEAGSLEIVKALVIELGNLPIFLPPNYLDSTPLTPEIRAELEPVIFKIQ